MVPVFPYYLMLQSTPASGVRRGRQGPLNLAEPRHDGRLLRRPPPVLQKAGPARRAPGRPPRRARPVGLHRAGARRPTTRRPSRRPSRRAATPTWPACRTPPPGFAKAIVRLRDQLAPNVILAYHLSVWGTKLRHPRYPDEPTRRSTRWRPRRPRFYASLGAALRPRLHRHRRSRRRASSRSSTATAARRGGTRPTSRATRRFIGGFVGGHGQAVVVWQIPMGNTKMRATNDTWGHYQDNRPSGSSTTRATATSRSWRDAGVVALLFGGGAGGTTCACDAEGDGDHEPARVRNAHPRLALGRRRRRLPARPRRRVLLDRRPVAGRRRPPPPPRHRRRPPPAAPAPAAGRPLRDVGRRVAQAGPPPARPQGHRPRARVGGSERSSSTSRSTGPRAPG